MDFLPTFLTQSPFHPAQVARSLWLIIGLPLLGAFGCGVFGRRLGRGNVNLLALSAVGGAFVLSVIAFWATVEDTAQLSSPFLTRGVRYALGHDYGTWFAAGMFRAGFGLSVDHLSGILLLVITGVGFLIHLYSISYMEHDEGYWRYFAYLNLFVAMMLTLVLADNLVLLFVGWEGVGLCSYLLIGFWYDDAAKAWAGRKAFITNRIGDFAFIIGMMLLTLLVGAFQLEARPGNYYEGDRGVKFARGVAEAGPLNFVGLEELARGLSLGTDRLDPKGGQVLPPVRSNAVSLSTAIAQGPLKGFTFGGVLTAVLLLFLLGAAGKSAQLPLYVWLPDAMAGPTPVSALIHAATMVTAGVYLFCRIGHLLVLSPLAMAVVSVVGALTALGAALIAFAQTDIKKVLAYSTVSQLGIMFIGVGTGAFWAAAFHLVTHAFFKACLFLGAGSVMHGNADETDITKLGGLRPQMRQTWATFALATAAITGVVPLSGFFSKDAILHAAHSTHLHGYGWATTFSWALGLLTALSTAFYMTRLYVLTFEGKRSDQARAAHAHESHWPMTVPLWILAGLAVVGLVWGLPVSRGQAVLENYTSPVFRTAVDIIRRHGRVVVHHSPPWGAWATALAVAWAGFLAALFVYLKYLPGRSGRPAPAFAQAVRKLAFDKFYVDEVYDFLLVRPLKFGSFILFRVVDAMLIDAAAVRGTAWVTQRSAALLRYLQTGDVQSYAAVMALALLGGVAYVLLRLS